MKEQHSITLWNRMNKTSFDDANVYIYGVPFDGAVSYGKGSSEAPEKIRLLARHIAPTTSRGEILDKIKIFDYGDAEIDLDWNASFKRVEEDAFKVIDKDRFSFFFGGDHSVSIPLQKAFGRKYKGKKLGIIHFDSHPDICDSYESSEWSHACTERRAVEDVIEPDGLSFVGLRACGPSEIEYMADNPGIKVITAMDFKEMGIKQVVNQLIQKYKDYDAMYITLDIDVLDPAFAPGTGTPEAGGITTSELMDVTAKLVSGLNVKVVDLVEVSPPLDNQNNITTFAAIKVLYDVLGAVNSKL